MILNFFLILMSHLPIARSSDLHYYTKFMCCWGSNPAHFRRVCYQVNHIPSPMEYTLSCPGFCAWVQHFSTSLSFQKNSFIYLPVTAATDLRSSSLTPRHTLRACANEGLGCLGLTLHGESGMQRLWFEVALTALCIEMLAKKPHLTWSDWLFIDTRNLEWIGLIF